MSKEPREFRMLIEDNSNRALLFALWDVDAISYPVFKEVLTETSEITDSVRLDWMIENSAKVAKVLDDYWCEILGRNKMRSYSAARPREAIDKAIEESRK